MESGARAVQEKAVVVALSRIAGVKTRRHGIDEKGRHWVQFQADFLYGIPGQCAACGAELWEGWLCAEDDAEYCNEHVATPPGNRL